MTARRFLDVAAIFKASRGVAAKHVDLRQHQLDAYTITSSLAKAAKSQTDRVTLTVKAASALAERFNGPGSDYSTQASQSRRPLQGASIPSQDGTSGKLDDLDKNDGLSQDHFYKRSDKNTPADPPLDGNLGVKQEKAQRYPLPNGSIPLTNTPEVPKPDKEPYSESPQTEPVTAPLAGGREETDEGLHPTASGRTSVPSSEEVVDPSIAEKAKRLQRLAEKQIPSRAAELPSTADSKEPCLKADQDRDVFYTPSSSYGQVLSALPRVKLPKNTEDVQESDQHVPDAQLNQDVFYSSSSKIEEGPVSQARVVQEQEQLSDEAYAELFRSPKVARTLSGQPKPNKLSKGLEMSGAQETPVKQTKAPQEKDQSSSNIRTAGQESKDGARNPQTVIVNSKPSQAKGSEDVHDLAADMAKDTEVISADPSQVSFVRDVSTAHIHCSGAD